jgi:hypothetical protein
MVQRRRILARWGTLVKEGDDQQVERWLEAWRKWAATRRETREEEAIAVAKKEEERLQEAVEYMKPRLIKMKQLAQLRDRLSHCKEKKEELIKTAEEAAAKVRPLRVPQNHEHALTSSTCTSYPPSQTSRRSSVAPSQQPSTARDGPPLINKRSTKALLEAFVFLKESVVDLDTDVNHVLALVDKARGPAAVKQFTSTLSNMENLLKGNKGYVDARKEAEKSAKEEEGDKKEEEKQEEAPQQVEPRDAPIEETKDEVVVADASPSDGDAEENEAPPAAEEEEPKEDEDVPPPEVTTTKEGDNNTAAAAPQPNEEEADKAEENATTSEEDESGDVWWPTVANSTAVHREDLLRRAVLEMPNDTKTQLHSAIRALAVVSDCIPPQQIELEIGEDVRRRVVGNAVLMSLIHSALR